MPWELSAERAVEQFGVRAVFGREELTATEINGMRTANIIARLYRQRERAENWAEWTTKNPDEAKVLEAAQKIWQTQSR